LLGSAVRQNLGGVRDLSDRDGRQVARARAGAILKNKRRVSGPE
jgi:hypothetical protein